MNAYGLLVIPNWHVSSVARSGVQRSRVEAGQHFEIYPPAYQPSETLGGQLEFALKYDGVNLEILDALFEKLDRQELVDYISSKPTGKYSRRIWFLYELLTGDELPLQDLTQGNYVDILDCSDYYTSVPIQVRRQRINDNLLGGRQFCPLARRTKTLQSFEQADLPGQCKRVLETYPRELLNRALSYLYTKETKSSFEIEAESPDTTRIERFVGLLHLAEQEDFFNRVELVQLQNRIVDDRFREDDLRISQNYVGQSVAWQQERVHYVAPKPGDLAELMEGMFVAHGRLEDVHPVIHAAISAFGFVFMHPFEDGNGRIHRFLIHNVLARRKFSPKGVIFPVSAAMLHDMESYDASLESFSKLLMPLVDYRLDDHGRMTVRNDTQRHYRFIDMTAQAEALFHFIETVVTTDLVQELRFLKNYDTARQEMQEIIDLPDRLGDLFIRFCLQNQGKLSARKRTTHFATLTDDEVRRMEKVVSHAYFADGDS